MNFGNKINHAFPSHVASLREDSTYSSQNNSLYPLNFQSAQIHYTHNASSCSTDSEQTFRQSRVPSPPKETSPKLYSEINRRLNSSKKPVSTQHNASPGRSPLKGTSMNCSPMKIKINAEIQAKSPQYLPLADRFSLTKEELSEKNKELQEIKVQNVKLASEVKSYREKENKLLGNIENRLGRFNIDLSHLSYMDIINKYQELLNEHKHLLSHSTQIEDLLRAETIRGEEQRAYINVLKQKLGINVQSSPYLPKGDDIHSLKSTVRYSQKPDEFESRISEQKDLSVDVSQKEVELIKLVDENSRIENEQNKREKESLLENLKEREVMINELTQENGRLSQEVIKYGKALSEINQKVATKMKDYDSLKGYVNLLKKEVEKQKKKVVLLECDVKEKDERLNDRKRQEIGNKKYDKGTSDLEEVIKENEVLERKTNILAERIAELKDLEVKWNKLSDKGAVATEESKPQANKEKDRVDAKEILNLKEEVTKLERKVELLQKEKEVLSETKEELYEMLSKSEEEIDSLKRKLKDKENVPTGVESKDKGQNEDVVSFLQEEVKIKQEEIEKLKGFIFNSEVKELVAEGVQATREMFNLEKNLYQKNRPIGNREEGVRKVKENLDGIKAKRKTLEEELFELWTCEKTKYENISKLQQKNFQLQNEVSRLMNELEINCSKYDGPTTNYSSFKQNTRSETETSFSRENQRKSDLTRQRANSRGLLQGKNDISVDQINNLPISADISKIRKRRTESEERH